MLNVDGALINTKKNTLTNRCVPENNVMEHAILFHRIMTPTYKRNAGVSLIENQ